MSKKKMKWISNDNKGEFNDEALFSDSALDAMIAESFSKESVRNGFLGARNKLNIPEDSFMDHMLKESAKNEKTSNTSVVGNYTRQVDTHNNQDSFRNPVNTFVSPKKEQVVESPLKDVMKLMEDMNLSEKDVIDRITAVNEPIEPAEVQASEGVLETGISIITERSVSVTSINGNDYIIICDKFGNNVSIPVATESDTTYSLKYMMNKFNENVLTDKNREIADEDILYILNDLAVTMARGQILWGKPDFIIEKEDFSDFISDYGFKEYDGTKLLLATTSNREYVLGYTIDISELVSMWNDIISRYYETKDSYESFDKLLITFAALYRIMVNNRYICYNELEESFVDYISMNQNIKETCDTIHEILETYASPNQNTPELNITINDSYINEIPTVEELMIDGSSETLGLFCEPNDDEDSEEDEYPNEYSESEDTEDGDGEEEYPDPIKMAEKFANEYAATHPEVNQNISHTGYVQNAESEGAPVGDNSFPGTTGANSEAVDTKQTSSNLNSSVKESNPYGGPRTGNSESDKNTSAGGNSRSGSSFTDTVNRHWNADVSDYTENKKEEKEIKEEIGSGNSDGVKTVQEEVQKVDKSDDDALIINVNRG